MLASPGRWPQIIVSEDLPAMLANILSMVDGRLDHNHMEFRVEKPDGSRVWFEGHGYALRDSEKQLIAIEGILTDVTERVSAAEKIAELARTDSVTGLPNRAAFLERLDLAVARARRGAGPFAVLYLDLDQFKDVNDTLGHAVGDALLQAVGDRLKSCVRETDLVARFGGDEFAVLQDEMTDVASAEHLATKIGEAIAAPYLIGGNQVHTTVSIGVVPYTDDVGDVESMMMKADLALYRAKDAGRNQFRFHDAELDRQVHERVQIGNDLHRAIERDEFELYYQPQVDLVSGRTVGLEALIRWNHPTRGPLMPSTFIPIAESNGSILPIGEWAVERASRQFRLWRDQGIAPPVIAVNISAAQFKVTGDLDRIVTEGLARYDLAANQLELELTESVLMETTQKHREAFERLRRIGVRLAIDDFGTGYSSLDYLRSFHVSRLKIDRRFIHDMTINPDDATIVRATISLGRELGIEVLAEGIETAEQQAFLISAGCKVAQGNYFGEPMPVDRASAWLQGNCSVLNDLGR
jgi:diguanylate cyclase (GGDEF)-like protein